MTKVCFIFNNRNLLNSSDKTPGIMERVHNILGGPHGSLWSHKALSHTRCQNTVYEWLLCMDNFENLWNSLNVKKQMSCNLFLQQSTENTTYKPKTPHEWKMTANGRYYTGMWSSSACGLFFKCTFVPLPDVVNWNGVCFYLFVLLFKNVLKYGLSLRL